MTLPAPEGAHPSVEALERARRGADDADARHARDHAALCPKCTAEEYRLDAFEKAAPLSRRKGEAEWARFGSPLTEGRRKPALVWLPTLAFAASALLAVGVIAIVRRGRGPEEVRSAPTTRVAGPEGVLSEAPREFPTAGTGKRRVFVFDADRRYQWTSEASTSRSISFPEDERRKLRTGVDYYWTVLSDEAANPGADTSASKRFRLR